MVVFVGHALLLSSVCLDINDISYMVVYEERGHLNRAMFYIAVTVQQLISTEAINAHP